MQAEGFTAASASFQFSHVSQDRLKTDRNLPSQYYAKNRIKPQKQNDSGIKRQKNLSRRCSHLCWDQKKMETLST
jgi:hypothetical protein